LTSGSAWGTADSLSFVGNSATYGAGFASDASGTLTTSCNFTSNIAGVNGGGAHVTSSVTLSTPTGCTFDQNQASAGGAIFLGSGCMYFGDGTSFTDNSATTDGGAIYLQESCTMSSSSCNFTQNSAAAAGGAIYVANVSTVTDAGSSFTSNTAASEGGAVRLGVASVFTATATSFTTNSAPIGGVFSLDNSLLTSTGCAFTQNSATGSDGGVVFLYNATTADTGSSFTSNTASTRGGVFFLDLNSALTLTSSNVTSNTAAFGGAIFAQTSSTVTDVGGCSFHMNQASVEGGAVRATSSSSYTATGSLSVTSFMMNSAGLGGAVSLDSASLTSSSGVIFSQNNATDGGAVSAVNDSSVTDIGSNFSANAATLSGGALFASNSTLSLTASFIEDNSASSEGGGMALSSGLVTASGIVVGSNTAGRGGGMAINGTLVMAGSCEVKDNAATGSFGGALWLGADGELTSAGSSWTQNIAASGGAIFSAGGTVGITSDVFSLNVATENGGALYASGGVLAADQCKIMSNTAVEEGGGLFATDECTVTDTASMFEANTATNAFGGAMSVSNSMLSLTLTTIKSNTAAVHGGGVYATSSPITASGVTVLWNSAVSGAGMISNGTVTLSACNFTANTASDQGAGLWMGSGGTLASTGTVWSENFAATDGGAVAVFDGNSTLSSDSFTQNEATTRGGALYTSSGAMSMSDCTFDANTADSGGAAYFVDDAVVVATSTVWSNNVGNTWAGAFKISIGCQGHFSDSTFNFNSAGSGGAILAYGAGSSLTLERVLVANSSVTGNGGGIWLDETASVTMMDSTVGDCAATLDGGGVYVRKSTFACNATTFERNVAMRGGAILASLAMSSVTSSNSFFTGNEASLLGGGAIGAISGAPVSSENDEFTANSATSRGGAVNMLGGGSLTLQGSVFTASFSSSKGGAVHCGSGAALSSSGTVWTNNEAAIDGGALFVTDCTVTLSGDQFTSNTGVNGGAVYTADASTVSMSSCTWSNNTAATAGGAMGFDIDSNVTTTNNTFSWNSAGSGGAVYGSEGCILMDTGSTWTGNEASVTGGAVTMINSDVMLVLSTFQGNMAPDGGALVATGSGSISAENTTWLQNTATNVAGAIYADLENGTVLLADSVFASNAAADGGGLYARLITVNSYRNVWENNTAGVRGGGVYLEATDFYHRTSSEFVWNKAEVEGDHIYVDNNSSVICACKSCNYSTWEYLSCTCDPGYAGPDWGTCVACDPGTFKASSGTSACADCARGAYNELYAQTVCLDCAVNSWSREPGAFDQYNCTCDPGYEGPGNAECYACNYGYFKPTNGTAQCLLCPDHQLSVTTAAFECVNKSDFCALNTSVSCVEHYAVQYGCHAQSVELPSSEECFLAVGTLGDCLSSECQSCNCSAPEVDPGCIGQCGVNLTEYPAPGCPASSINDNTCDALCMTSASLYDGGDCIRDLTNQISVLFSAIDGEHPCTGCITYNATMSFDRAEFAEFSSTAGWLFFAAFNFSDIDVDGSDSVDIYELSLVLLLNEGRVDDFLQGQTLNRQFGMLASAKALLVHGDVSRNGVLEPDELAGQFGIDASVLKLVGEGREGVSMVELLATLNVVMLGLAGYAPPEGVDTNKVVEIVLRLADHSNDMMLNFGESGVLLFSSAMFEAIDADSDGLITLSELRAAFETSTGGPYGGCSGYQQRDQRSGSADVQLPAIPPPTCTVLVLPEWHFYREPDPVAGGCQTQAALRRSAKGRAAQGSELRSRSKAGSDSTHSSFQRRSMVDQASAETTHSTARSSILSQAEAEWSFLISLTTGNDTAPYCAGALIHPEWVITAARCVVGRTNAVVAMDQVVVHGGNESACGGGQHEIAEVLVHPGYSAWTGENDVALLRLARAATVPPVELYAGGDLHFSDCKPIALETAAYTAAGTVWDAKVDVVNHEVCDDWAYLRDGVRGVVPEGMGCAVPAEDGGWQLPGQLAAGSPVVSRVKGKPPRLVGVVTDKDTKSAVAEWSQLALITGLTSWVWSHKELGASPPRALHLEFNRLSLPAGVNLSVFAAPGTLAGNEALLLNPAAQPNATLVRNARYSDRGAGSLLVEVVAVDDPSAVALLRLEAALDQKTCEEEREATGTCVEGCVGGGCKDVGCTLRAVQWPEIVPMLGAGSAFSGGMGSLARTFQYKDDASWLCIRDWDQAEQLKCAAGPGQLACFLWNQKQETFSFYGLNSDVALVTPGEKEGGEAREDAGLSKLPHLEL